ncbi:MAG: hypothetical protein ABH840_01175 [Nanoarchaeota archaeon]
MADINLHSIEGIVIAECPSCNNDSAFLYTGIWEGYKGMEDLILYHCFTCETTLAHTSVLRNRKR